MDLKKLRTLLENVKNGNINIDSAVESLKTLPFEDLGFAKIDNHRNLRSGYPEVIYCPGKTAKQIQSIMHGLLKKNSNIMATKASEEIFSAVKEIAIDAVYYEVAKIIAVRRDIPEISEKTIGIVSAGTSDIPIAEEAAITAEIMGNRVKRIYDVGVAGIHRLFANMEDLTSANVLVVVAGMEGALASVTGGLVNKPVIAVPTSVGYGANFAGLSALLTMLNSCALGVSVVNIDNGFGAGYLASMINKL